jgi:hypothetical protein
MIGKSDPTEFSSPQDPIKESSNQQVKSNGIRRKLPLTKGQQLYLIGKYHVNKMKIFSPKKIFKFRLTI